MDVDRATPELRGNIRQRRRLAALVPIDPEACVAAIDARRGSRRRWHIIGEDGDALCGTIPEDTEMVMRSLGELALPPAICRLCHTQYSWSEQPHEFELQDNGYPGLPCKVWPRTLDPYGYGRRRRSPERRPHREAYEAAYGPIPDGWVVHHLCEVKTCLEPTHLEAMSRADHCRLHQPEQAGRR